MTSYTLQCENDLRKSIEELLSKMEKEIRKRMPDVLFAYDGFFPLYSLQGKRILIVGREAYGDYATYRRQGGNAVSITDASYDEYRHNELFRGGSTSHFDGKALTRRSVKYHARCIALAYSIITGNWDVPAEKIREIASRIGDEEGISYAYFNFSKILNQNADKAVRANRKMIRAYALLDYMNGTLKREIELVDPDIIITQGLNELCGYIGFNCFSSLGNTSHKDTDKKKRSEEKPLIIEKLYGKRTIDIIDVRHFSGCSLKYWKRTVMCIKEYLECKA